MDPEDARAIIDPALGRMIDAVRRYEVCRAVDGDGIFALFGAPVAREHHPQRTLYTAMRMQDEIRRYSARLRAHCTASAEQSLGTPSDHDFGASLQTTGSA